MNSLDVKRRQIDVYSKMGFYFPIIICTFPIYYPLFICFTNGFHCSPRRFVQLVVTDGSNKTLFSRFPVFYACISVSQSSFLALDYSSLCAYFFISTYSLKNSWFFLSNSGYFIIGKLRVPTWLMIYISYNIISKSTYLWGFSG